MLLKLILILWIIFAIDFVGNIYELLECRSEIKQDDINEMLAKSCVQSIFSTFIIWVAHIYLS